VSRAARSLSSNSPCESGFFGRLRLEGADGIRGLIRPVETSTFSPSVLWILPFVTLLFGIAIIPLAAPRFWASNVRKLAVSAGLAAPVLWLYGQHQPSAIMHTAEDYVSFMILLGSLFVTSGGVRMDGDLEATPAVNTMFLGVGALAASVIGTTGASMLLIRPLLHTNSERRRVVHTVVFFIFLVSNIGGCLTPLGDPPLFLGYLQGVPFTWTLRLAPAWLFATVTLLAIYFIWDTRAHAAEPPERLRSDATRKTPLTLQGKEHLGWLAGVVAAAALLGSPWREFVMVGLSVVSYVRASTAIHESNHFSLHPIIEVAVIFAGIFSTMIPALDILRHHGMAMGVTEPWHFFWATGVLSSFLDNAPTYLTFLALAQGLGLQPDVAGVSHQVLSAISLGAVFMGANSYIGNGPNFMVRSIAEARGVRMPSFAGYLAYSGAILIPVFVLVTFVFFRP
jgi:Na+/H+ antiporter NhaD/arsenite permease-like protein